MLQYSDIFLCVLLSVMASVLDHRRHNSTDKCSARTRTELESLLKCVAGNQGKISLETALCLQYMDLFNIFYICGFVLDKCKAFALRINKGKNGT